MSDISWFLDMDAVGIVSAVRSRAVSSAEIVDAALLRIGEVDGALNACWAVLEREARAAARDADRMLASDGPAGPLHGVPLIVKDVVWVKGAPATMGSGALSHFAPPEDAAVVRRLRKAGAIVVAKSTNPDFLWHDYIADDLHGITRNPWCLSRTPGASSGGSAAAVAAGMVPLALGTDAAGSIRGPAAFCGIVGHKPTHGLVPRTPGFEELRTTNVVGPMTRTVRDAALALNVLAGPDPSDDLCIPVEPVDFVEAVHRIDVAALRIAWAPDILDAAQASVRTVIGAMVDRLAGAGLTLEPVSPQLPARFAYPIWLAEIGDVTHVREELLSSVARRRFADARQMSSETYYAAQLQRARFTEAWERSLAGYDVLLMASVPRSAPPIGSDSDPASSNSADGRALTVANLTGRPALSIPVGLTADGMPAALEVMAPRGDDAACLAVAAAIEQLAPQQKSPSPRSTNWVFRV